ncbi:MAG: VOC family protein [Reinekea sp.]|nr:VOC family protein [Reinekea sp.]
MNINAPLQVELFVSDIALSIDFYARVLGFKIGERQPDGYTPMSNGSVRISLNAHVNLPDDHPIHIAAGERPGRGVEFVLWVDDLQDIYAHVQAQGWPISGELQRQPWGLDDFRLQDQDGYYLRFTSDT